MNQRLVKSRIRHSIHLVVGWLAGSGLAVVSAWAEEAPAPAVAAPQPAPPAADVTSGAPAAPTADPFWASMQATYIWQRKPDMPANYTYPDANSLGTEAETGYTLSATLFLGARPWRNTEVLVNPETIQSQNISGLHGLGGPSNGEAQKGGGPTPHLYLARAFVRQSIALGGEATAVEPGPNQFAQATARRRLVITAGMMSILDVFDGNQVTHDARTQFLNWALLTHGAFDYAADARGYTWGLAVEYDHDNWAFRLGRFLTPKESNGQALDFDFIAHYGDNLEIEHTHNLRGRPGRIRVLGYRNHERMGAFADAVSAATATGATPTLDGVGVRRDQAKWGLGIAVDQALGRDATAFVRGSWNDGRTETYSFTEIDRSLALGASMRGPLWRRPGDTVGTAFVVNGLSEAHRDYLSRGGHGFFIGDGQLNYRPEQLVEIYYSALTFHHLWLSGDYQYVANPGYNRDRGPAQFLGVRLHLDM